MHAWGREWGWRERLSLHAVIYNGSNVNFTCNRILQSLPLGGCSTGVDCNVLAMSVLFGTKEAGYFRDVAAL